MARYKPGHREQTRAAIVDAASRVLRHKGFAEVSIGDVMNAIGLTHGGFYAHFADKTDMLVAAVEQAFVESPKNFSALAAMANAAANPTLVATHYLSDKRVDDAATGCPAAAFLSEIPRQEGAVRAAFVRGAEETRKALAAVRGLSNDGEDRSWAALSMLFGGLAMMRAVPDVSTRALIRTQIGDALRALAATRPVQKKRAAGAMLKSP